MERIKNTKVLVFALFCLLAGALSSDVVDLTPDNFHSVVDGSKYVFVEFYAPWCGYCKKLAPEYEIVATSFKNIPDVVIAKVDADAHRSLMQEFGVTGFPTLKFFPKTTSAEDFSGNRDVEGIIKFINERVPGHLRASAPVPPPSDVVVLTPENFDSIVLDASKDVFVEFYAPWCGHCKRLAPTWEKLATIFNGEESVVIANLNADEHKSLGARFGVSGFPTLIYFPKDNKEGIRYEKARELNDLLTYVNEQAGTQRLENGRLSSTVGIVQDLTDTLKEYTKEKTTEILEKAKELLSNIQEKSPKIAVVYKRILQSLEEGTEYITKEIERVEKMMKGSLTSSKIDDFTVRLNILKSVQ